MERKVIRTIVGELINLTWPSYYEEVPFCINTLIEKLQKAKENNATHVAVDIYYDHDEINDIILLPINVHKESDEAYNKRLEKHKKGIEEGKKLVEKQERQLYEELKKKYENK